jgi:hypothetical protein
VKNAVILAAIACVLLAAMIIGAHKAAVVPPGPGGAGQGNAPAAALDQTDLVPHIGRVQVLNGCGTPGAANRVADFLRSHRFDVKDIGNAPTGNYAFTLVVSRVKDTAVAGEVAAALGTDKCFLLRSGDGAYDATVYIGADFEQRIAGGQQ